MLVHFSQIQFTHTTSYFVVLFTERVMIEAHRMYSVQCIMFVSYKTSKYRIRKCNVKMNEQLPYNYFTSTLNICSLFVYWSKTVCKRELLKYNIFKHISFCYSNKHISRINNSVHSTIVWWSFCVSIFYLPIYNNTIDYN